MYELLAKMTRGEATLRDLDLLEELAPLLRDTSLCGLGQTAPNPVVSTLRYFRDEYLAHITEKRCPAGVCTMASAVGAGNGAHP
jgi:NADH:ubiquinone oxidoreductase subunit F (NADH-binding)